MAYQNLFYRLIDPLPVRKQCISQGRLTNEFHTNVDGLQKHCAIALLILFALVKWQSPLYNEAIRYLVKAEAQDSYPVKLATSM
ncbi:hypothetical protein H6F93_08785 [Leptolyngbya sp. FACHB-671]|uniref:hypothetical protein n=1 Tax=Leptolyngbya sp. FACHB-671 TaxID=2692812 RepID=UPI00168514B6|nr:hypothetical protein [Leptolyngbya sp. FACHB-671]MBD2067625.1 hypothetical protein [Leptolyngbya sp. FACHB-671]